MKKIIYILFVSFFGSLLLVNTSSASICDNKDTVVFYGNGVKALKKNADDSKKTIRNRLKKNLPQEKFAQIGFDIAYNDTHTIPLDLLESTIQILSGNVRRFWHIFFGHEIMPEPVAEIFLRITDGIDYSALITTDSLRDHVKTYQNAIDEGKKIILVAHSQGNLYGNQAYNLLASDEKQSFAMVSVATVDNNVLGDYTDSAPYTTLTTDRIVQAIIIGQLNLPTSPMDPNTENIVASDEFWGHSFLQSYMMEGSNSSIKITGDIISALDSLTAPYQQVVAGVITVSLTWGNAPDVDLHVYEPNGSHVYWYNLEGISGALDVDDRSRYGPEHYNVSSCDSLEEGIYSIELDYYEGSYPETATLQVEAGLLVRTFQVAMPSDIYGSPYYPVYAASISVQMDDNGEYSFDIHH